MTRAELEATIWRAMRAHQVTCPGPARFVNTVLAAADAYGLAEFGLEAERRRAVLADTVGGGSYGGRAS